MFRRKRIPTVSRLTLSGCHGDTGAKKTLFHESKSGEHCFKKESLRRVLFNAYTLYQCDTLTKPAAKLAKRRNSFLSRHGSFLEASELGETALNVSVRSVSA